MSRAMTLKEWKIFRNLYIKNLKGLLSDQEFSEKLGIEISLVKRIRKFFRNEDILETTKKGRVVS